MSELNGVTHQLTANQMSRIMQTINSLTQSRDALWRNLLDTGKRDLNKEFQYPENPGIETYRKLYERVGTAVRVVHVYPDECWSVYPTIYERETKRNTRFERAFQELNEERNLLHYAHRLDRMQGIGQYGCMLIGLDDGRDLSQPVRGVREDGTREAGGVENKVTFLRVFDEHLARVTKLETNPSNPRFGQPVEYQLSLIDINTSNGAGIITPQPQMNANQYKVHWSRVFHSCDNRMSSEVFGVPRMQPVVNNLYDIRKIAGGSAEMFWRGALPGYSVQSQPNVEVGDPLDEESVRTQFERFMNGLQRYIALTGMEVNSLAPQVADPESHLTQQLLLIALTLEVPMRVFVGSEAAHLASTQDIATWNRRLGRRQRLYLDPMMIIPLIRHFQMIGVLPPAKSVVIEWTDLNSLTDEQKANVALKKTQALQQFVSGGVETRVDFFLYLTDVIGLSEERANLWIEESEKEDRDLVSEDVWKQPEPAPLGSAKDPAAKTGKPAGNSLKKPKKPVQKPAAK